MVEEIRKGDIDTTFLVTIKDGTVAVDISSASTMNIIFEKSDGTIVTKDATLNSDGTDGKMYYKTIDGDLDLTGSWKIQGYVVIGIGKWKSSIDNFEVYENLE